MRLWHKNLIEVLPNKQLLGQWRECCAIASDIANKGEVKHLLVRKIMDYPADHFIYYTRIVATEMEKRGYNYNPNCFVKHLIPEFNKNFSHEYDDCIMPRGPRITHVPYDLFYDWHDDRYLKQCYYNLQEKFDCEGISFDDFDRIRFKMIDLMGLAP